VLGKYAGCGKSFVCRHMVKLGYRVLFVYPNNEQVRESQIEGTDAVTINTFFSFGVTEDQHMSKFDDSQYNCIVFDEIFNHNVYELLRIYRYINNNKDKIILGAGDVHQLEAVESSTNTKDNDTYLTNCVNMMFPYMIKLNEIKRIENKEQISVVKNMYDDILYKNKHINYIIKTYNIKVINDNQYTKLLKNSKCCSIALTNERCKTINKIVRKTQGRGEDYEIGDVLRCIKRLKKGDVKINKNYVYKIISVGNKNISVLDEAINEEYTLERHIIDKHFIYGYARTVYSIQGKSIKENVIIHQIDHGYATKKWLYVAISRATDLNNIYIYRGKNELINEESIKSYFTKK